MEEYAIIQTHVNVSRIYQAHLSLCQIFKLKTSPNQNPLEFQEVIYRIVFNFLFLILRSAIFGLFSENAVMKVQANWATLLAVLAKLGNIVGQQI